MSMRHAIGALAAMLVLQLVAGASPAEAQKGRKNNVITAEEIANSGGSNAYDLIKTLRPQWLRARGISTGMPDPSGGGVSDPGSGIIVYVDGVRVGGLDQLENIGAERIQELRYLSANDATQKYGTGHTQGAIEVATKH
jgi:hypothetical protein